jgi:hypothetical protein
LFGLPFIIDDLAGQGDLDGITVAMKMYALTVVIGDAMSCIVFQAAGDKYVGRSQFLVARVIAL